MERVGKERKEAKAKAKSQRERRKEETKGRAKTARAPGKAQRKASPCGRKDLERKAKAMTKVAKDPKVEHATPVGRWATLQRIAGKEWVKLRRPRILEERVHHHHWKCWWRRSSIDPNSISEDGETGDTS